MNSQTKDRLLILITRLQICMTHTFPTSEDHRNEMKRFHEEAEDLKNAFAHDETIVEVR